ncbi:MAG: ParB/RepB/Spo0J family partition protein [Nitrososphaeria archaeon]
MKELAKFLEPVKKQECKFCILKIDEINIPPIQRDLSESLRKQLELAIDKLGFLIPIIVSEKDGNYYVIDGQHRLEALRSLGVSEVLAIVVDENYYKYILDFNTEKAPNIKEKSKQTYRLYKEILEEDPETNEESLFTLVKEPALITFGFAIEEYDSKFPASFYESFVSKIDNFINYPLKEAADERRKRAEALISLNQVVNEKYAEFGWDNALLKGEIIRKAVQKAYGVRVRTIGDSFYDAIEAVKGACKELSILDFEAK